MRHLNKDLFTKVHKIKPLLLQDVFKPLYILTTLLGLFPYSIVFNKNKHTFVIVRNSIYVNSLCAVTICLIIFFFLALHIKEVLSDGDNLTEAILTQINYITEIVTLILFCVVAFVCAFLNRVKYVDLLNQIASTWNELPSTDSKHQLENLRFQVNFVCLGTLFIVIIVQIILLLTRKSSWWKFSLLLFTFDLPQIIQCVTLALFYILVRMVVLLLITINCNCLRLLKYDEATKTPAFTRRLSLRQMERIYVRAYEIKTKINEAFQGPILVTTLQCFHGMVSEAHLIYHAFVVHNSITTHEVFDCSIWIFYQVLKIYAIAYCGNLLKFQALKIGQTLHKIPIEKHDDRWLMEIQHFSTMIYYQNIELTVYGYFPLNSTLIYNMLASATMYYVILVQMDKDD